MQLGVKMPLRPFGAIYPFHIPNHLLLGKRATFRSIEHHTKINIKYIKANVNPGITAPINKFPTETCIMSAIIINIMLGGISIPRVPDAAITPVKVHDYIYFLTL